MIDDLSATLRDEIEYAKKEIATNPEFPFLNLREWIAWYRQDNTIKYN
jgi:hypothetical protein